MSQDIIAIRLAETGERNALIALHHRALRELSAGFVSPKTTESFIQNVETLDDFLITDRRYYVVTVNGHVAACGGWSQRTPAYESLADDANRSQDHHATPIIRAMFVDPAFARRGLGRHLLTHIEQDILHQGFSRATLTATPMGRRLYETRGWITVTRWLLKLPGDCRMNVYDMEKWLGMRTTVSGSHSAEERPPSARLVESVLTGPNGSSSVFSSVQ